MVYLFDTTTSGIVSIELTETDVLDLVEQWEKESFSLSQGETQELASPVQFASTVSAETPVVCRSATETGLVRLVKQEEEALDKYKVACGFLTGALVGASAVLVYAILLMAS